MVSDVRITTAVAKVLAALLVDPTVDRYGLDLMRATGHPSGTLYPILLRLQDAGGVVARWAAGRPARRYYRLTEDGAVAARKAVAALYESLGRGHFTFPGIVAPPGSA